MKDFAKLFTSQTYGQILVVIEENDKGNPCIRFTTQPKNMGLCSVSMGGSDDSDEVWDKLEEVFDAINQDAAETAISDLYKTLPPTE